MSEQMRPCQIERVPPRLGNGIQRLYAFPNGYGASVIQSSMSYGHEAGLWELAVTRVIGGDATAFRLCYLTPVTNDVEGHLTESDVNRLLAAIEALPQAPPEVTP